MRRLSRTFLTALHLACLTSAAEASANFFGKSYALVVGIDDYASEDWPDLNYGEKDARAMAELLEGQDYDVTALYGKEATRENILWALGGEIAPRLTRRDRILLFFSGHGETRDFGWRQFGYVVPFDGTDKFSSWISMAELREMSEQMIYARHQLFIFDSCYGGSIGRKADQARTEIHPRYIEKVSSERARQFLTAGGKDEQVLDAGPSGYSYFTGFLLQALEGKADINKDSYVTMTELASFLLPAASSWDQTPRWGVMSGHEQGEYWFRVPGVRSSGAVAEGPMPLPPSQIASVKSRGPAGPVEPEFLADAQGPPDNLMLIKGIGNSLQEELHELGIYHFWQIAEWTDENLLWIRENTFKIKGRAEQSWIEDAKRLLGESDPG